MPSKYVILLIIELSEEKLYLTEEVLYWSQEKNFFVFKKTRFFLLTLEPYTQRTYLYEKDISLKKLFYLNTEGFESNHFFLSDFSVC